MVTGTNRHLEEKYMRNLLIAGLMLSPMLIPSTAVASSPKTDATVATQNRRISTGISTPEIIDPSSIHLSAADLGRMVPSEGQVVLSLKVDENGNASNVQIVRPLTPEVNARLVSEVSRAHFRPAKLDNQNVAVDMNLVITVRR